MARNPARPLLLIIMNILIVLAVFMTVALVVSFFGALAAQSWGQAILRIADMIDIPTGVASIKTPYGGEFNVNYTITIAVLLLAEWGIGSLRTRA